MIQQLVRPEVAKITPYTANAAAQGKYKLILDANESPYPLPEQAKGEMLTRLTQLDFNRYPDTSCQRLRSKIANYLGGETTPEEIMVGNGSDELLHLLTQTFVATGEKVLAISPSFSMYKIFSQLAGGNFHTLPLASDGSFEPIRFWEAVEEIQPKLIFLCSPNNPTGTRIPQNELMEIAKTFKGILVVDEAYGEFTTETMVAQVKNYPNLVVTRTFSKAFGLAAIRLGYMVADPTLIQEVSKTCLPYHLNSVTQMMGEVILDHWPIIQQQIERILQERQRVYQTLLQGGGWHVLSSEANFLYLTGEEVTILAEELACAGIRIRQFTNTDQPACRITIGKPEENDQVIQIIQQIQERGRRNGTNS